jgi:hypothetical protein
MGYRSSGVLSHVKNRVHHQARPIALRLFASLAVSIAAAHAAPADLADLTRALDGVQVALDKAAADAQAGKLPALQSSLKSAQEKWSRFFVGYRGWGSGTDPSWITDIDAIQAEFMNATNAVSPGNNAPMAAAALKRIQEMLAALRERNEVPDVKEAAEDLKASLNEVQKAMKALEGKAFGPDTLAALSEQWVQISASWTSFNEVLVEANALGLSQGDLANLARRVERQGIIFDAVGKALANANLSSGLTSVNSAIEGLRDLASLWAAQSDDDDAGDPKALLDPRRKRGLNYR